MKVICTIKAQMWNRTTELDIRRAFIAFQLMTILEEDHHILVLKKCKKYDDVLFINASEHFENGKRQNVLLSEHIEKIIETYQYRREEERYSRRVSMDKIEENDFNLNISRYVSTAEPEERVDLALVHTELTKLAGQISENTKNHNKFLKELGLPELPYAERSKG